jgi:hypothetical protein
MTMQFNAVKSTTAVVTASAIWVFGDELIEHFYPGGWTPDAEGVPNPAYRPDFDINLCNANAHDVAGALGWEIADGHLEVPIDPAIASCTAYLQRRVGRPSSARPPRAIHDAPLFIEALRPEGYLERTIHRIALMLREGKARGATHLVAA